jgi:DNA-binding winged helix-turn-helix (wHTH) protein/TolB-like protein
VGRYRFGEFEFDADSGELLRVDGSGEPAGERLAPQPARLLGLLAERGGELLAREEIREAIWGGVEVDFDASLHFCIRQIRSALGDSASEPRYVATLPRRGYRLLPPVERIGAPAQDPGRVRPRAWKAGAAVGALAIVLGTIFLLANGFLRRPPDPPMRIGIMPFEPVDGSGAPNAIAEVILETLMERLGSRAEIVGPTTTVSYTDATMARLASDYDLRYIVNGRFLDDEHGRRMLGELIRASDGAHVWVRSYPDPGDASGIGAEISPRWSRSSGWGKGPDGGSAGRGGIPRHPREAERARTMKRHLRRSTFRVASRPSAHSE